MASEPPFTIGIEEEYLLVSRATRDLANPPPEMFAQCEAALGGRVSPEFLRSQIEVGTLPHGTLQEARQDLAHLRRTVSQVAADFDLAIIAASTHPFAHWRAQKTTPKERYSALEKDLQGVVRRLLICGMHVHVGIDDPDLRVDLMNQFAYFTPHLLALSTSSPFWEGQDQGLQSYRLSVFNELPRTGTPDEFNSFAEYQRHVEILVNAGVIEDATKIWWDIRPSARYPTVETRICDMCTRLDDAMCIAACTVCLLGMLCRLRRNNQRWRRYSRLLIEENRWRAQRYGLDEGLLDLGIGRIVPYRDLFGEIVELGAGTATDIGCRRELAHGFDIIDRGTSAHNQRRVYHQALEAGADEPEALKAVVDFLIEETVRDL